MESKKIKIKEALELQVQLAGFKNAQASVKGILDEKISIKTKYWLGKVLTEISKEQDSFNKLREELIKKYGEEGDNGFEIKPTVDGKPNKKLTKFMEEINTLLEQDIEIKFPSLSIDDFDFESENNYSFLLSFIINEN